MTPTCYSLNYPGLLQRPHMHRVVELALTLTFPGSTTLHLDFLIVEETQHQIDPLIEMIPLFNRDECMLKRV